jgi:hypothetical protein
MMFEFFAFLSGLLQRPPDPNEFNGFLILGYGVMWLVAMVYIISLYSRQRNVRDEIKLLEQLLREDERPADV